jgi:hypothetical protein
MFNTVINAGAENGDSSSSVRQREVLSESRMRESCMSGSWGDVTDAKASREESLWKFRSYFPY